MSVFSYGVEVRACAYASKYLSNIDKFLQASMDTWVHQEEHIHQRCNSNMGQTTIMGKKIANTDTHRPIS